MSADRTLDRRVGCGACPSCLDFSRRGRRCARHPGQVRDAAEFYVYATVRSPFLTAAPDKITLTAFFGFDRMLGDSLDSSDHSAIVLAPCSFLSRRVIVLLSHARRWARPFGSLRSEEDRYRCSSHRSRADACSEIGLGCGSLGTSKAQPFSKRAGKTGRRIP